MVGRGRDRPAQRIPPRPAAIERRTIDLPITAENPGDRPETLLQRAPRFDERTTSVRSRDGESIIGPPTEVLPTGRAAAPAPSLRGPTPTTVVTAPAS